MKIKVLSVGNFELIPESDSDEAILDNLDDAVLEYDSFGSDGGKKHYFNSYNRRDYVKDAVKESKELK